MKLLKSFSILVMLGISGLASANDNLKLGAIVAGESSIVAIKRISIKNDLYFQDGHIYSADEFTSYEKPFCRIYPFPNNHELIPGQRLQIGAMSGHWTLSPNIKGYVTQLDLSVSLMFECTNPEHNEMTIAKMKEALANSFDTEIKTSDTVPAELPTITDVGSARLVLQRDFAKDFYSFQDGQVSSDPNEIYNNSVYCQLSIHRSYKAGEVISLSKPWAGYTNNSYDRGSYAGIDSEPFELSDAAMCSSTMPGVEFSAKELQKAFGNWIKVIF